VNSACHFSYLTSYGYDALDNLTGVNQSGLTRSFAYDSLKRLVAARNPENASAASPGSLNCGGAVAGNNWTTCYSYDPVGNLQTKKDNRNVMTSYLYL
jgi:YD repeat-containing protein